MKESRVTKSQIIGVLKQVDAGLKLEDVCREHGSSPATHCKWKLKYGGVEASDHRRMKDLEEENARGKRMFADLGPLTGPQRPPLKNQIKPASATGSLVLKLEAPI